MKPGDKLFHGDEAVTIVRDSDDGCVYVKRESDKASYRVRISALSEKKPPAEK